VKFQEENEEMMPTHSDLEEINEEILQLEKNLKTQIQTFETYKIHEEATQIFEWKIEGICLFNENGGIFGDSKTNEKNFKGREKLPN
jgi:hypothetical protein